MKEPQVHVSMLDILGHLPVKQYRSWLDDTELEEITHATLHTRKKWGNGEYVAFHTSSDTSSQKPWWHMQNTRHELDMHMTFIPVSEADRVSIKYNETPYQNGNFEACHEDAEGDSRPAARRSAQKIFYSKQ